MRGFAGPTGTSTLIATRWSAMVSWNVAVVCDGEGIIASRSGVVRFWRDGVIGLEYSDACLYGVRWVNRRVVDESVRSAGHQAWRV